MKVMKYVNDILNMEMRLCCALSKKSKAMIIPIHPQKQSLNDLKYII